MRAKIILCLAVDPCVSQAAQNLQVDRKTIRLWRDRYLRKGRKGLKSNKRPGRHREISNVSRCQVVAMACGKPKDFDVSFREVWTINALLKRYRQLNPELDCLSRTSVWRILNKVDIKRKLMELD